MKAVIIIPPIEDFYFTYHRFAYLGALRAAEILESERNFKTEIINFTDFEKKQIPIPGYLKHLKPHILEGETGSCSFFSIFRRYGPDVEKCCRIITDKSPDAVFFSLFAYCYAEPMIELAELLKKTMPELPLIAGGAGVSVYPEYFLSHFDVVLPGEGEIVLKEYINSLKGTEDGLDSHAIKSSVKNSTVNGKNIYSHTAEGDFSLSINTAQSDKSSVNISAVLSRGCNKRCRFCSNFITHGRDFRKTPPELVKKELERKNDIFLKHSGKKYFINFEDDNLMTDEKYFFAILKIFSEYFIQFTSKEKILFSAENGLDYNLLTTKSCSTLIDMNFRQFNFTLGSVSSEIIGREKRSGSSKHLSEILKYLEKRTVSAVSYFIAGMKNDTPEKVIESLLFLAENPGIAGISMFYSVPGLPDFDSENYFQKTPPGLLRGSSAYPWNSSLTTEELITAFRISRTVNLFKKANPDQSDNELISKVKQEKKLYTIVKKNKVREIVRPPSVNRKMEELFFSRFDL